MSGCAMALTFRYRFVDFGTRFAAAEGTRAADQGLADPFSLFANELVTDVGGTCCSGDEPLAIIDHHFTREAQFPSASAAVLHKAKYIRDRFANTKDGIFWLVTHVQPDFDAFCSMYLARWILEDPAAIVDWESWGLHRDGWLDSVDQKKIKWFDPELHAVSAEQRWPLLMASYASIVDNGKHFPCPRSRAVHSILYAALTRGRDYLNETSGARELFDEIKTAICQKKRNPIFDSVLHDSTEFAPELEMLDREVEAYHRDFRRARKSIVYLQRSPDGFFAFFDKLKEIPLLNDTGAINPEHLGATQPRVATDGIYLRDPECLLFKEWARLDLENSSLGRGFEFTAIAYSSGRPDGQCNQTDYFFAIDPERANGRHLYEIWARLQAKEVAALRRQERQVPEKSARRSFEKRAGAQGKYFADPWFDGQNYFCTIVATPNRGTLIASPGTDAGLIDDTIAEVVRSEVEYSIYLATAAAENACVAVRDLSAVRSEPDIAEVSYDIAHLQRIEAPAGRRFRFARIPLHEDVPVSLTGKNGLSQQIGDTLWQVLYPDLQDAKPQDFERRHLVVAPRCVGVWGDRGIAIAYKPAKHATSAPATNTAAWDDGGSENDFVAIVELACGIDTLIADGKKLAELPSGGSHSPSQHEPEKSEERKLAEKIAAEGEDLARQAAQIKHSLTLPDSDLLRRFYEAIGIDELLTTLRDLNHTAAEYLRREAMEEQARKTRESTETVAEVQSKLEFLEVFIVGVYALEMFDMFTKYIKGEADFKAYAIMGGGLGFLVLTTFLLVPWRRTWREKRLWKERPLWILLVAVLLYLAAIWWGWHVGFQAGPG
jgi:hypothetical protein